MKSLFRYLLKNHVLALFLLLETFSLALVFNYNSFQKSQYLNSTNRVTGTVYNTYHQITRYFGLIKVNKELARENAQLHTLLQKYSNRLAKPDILKDTASGSDALIRFIPAEVINNSVNSPFNYITLNKGSNDGIKPDQGIISPLGVVGVVAQVSPSYSMGLSVLNQRWSVSAKLSKTGFFGSLIWQGNDYRFAQLAEIPLHVPVEIGDTVVTSGYSTIFPEKILIGTVHDFTRPDGENFYDIEVKLAVDFKSLTHVEVIENLNKEEIDRLKEMLRDDK